MNLLQEELDQVKDIWNSHLIRKQSRVVISGIPDDLHCFPELRGKIVVTGSSELHCYV